jgi:hypothetical protein
MAKPQGVNMAIEVKSTKNAAKHNGVKMLVVAPSGAGKTNLLQSTGKTIMLSAEGGDLTLNDYEIDSIRVTTLQELREAYEYVLQNIDKYDTVGIDSISEIGEMIVSDLKKDPEFASMKDSMKLWMRFSDVMLAIAKSFRDLNGINVVILALPEAVRVGYNDKILPLIPAKKVQAKLGSLYDEVLMIAVDEEGKRNFVCQPTGEFDAKDRSGKLPATIEYHKDEGLKEIFKLILGEKK